MYLLILESIERPYNMKKDFKTWNSANFFLGVNKG